MTKLFSIGQNLTIKLKTILIVNSSMTLCFFFYFYEHFGEKKYFVFYVYTNKCYCECISYKHKDLLIYLLLNNKQKLTIIFFSFINLFVCCLIFCITQFHPVKMLFYWTDNTTGVVLFSYFMCLNMIS